MPGKPENPFPEGSGLFAFTWLSIGYVCCYVYEQRNAVTGKQGRVTGRRHVSLPAGYVYQQAGALLRRPYLDGTGKASELCYHAAIFEG